MVTLFRNLHISEKLALFALYLAPRLLERYELTQDLLPISKL